MIKKNLIIIFIFLLFYNISYSADSNSNDVEFLAQETTGDPKKVSEYNMAVKFIKKAKEE